jgi:hypothetical protein
MQPLWQNKEKRALLSAFQRYRYEAERAGQVADYEVFLRVYENCENNSSTGVTPAITRSASYSAAEDVITEAASRSTPARYRRRNSTPEVGPTKESSQAASKRYRNRASTSKAAGKQYATVSSSPNKKAFAKPKGVEDFYVGPCTCYECIMKSVNPKPMQQTTSNLPARYRNRNTQNAGPSRARATTLASRNQQNYAVDSNIPLYYGNFITKAPGAASSLAARNKGKARARSSMSNPKVPPAKAGPKQKKKVTWAPNILELPKRHHREFNRYDSAYKPGRWSCPGPGWQNTSWNRYRPRPMSQGKEWNLFEKRDESFLPLDPIED